MSVRLTLNTPKEAALLIALLTEYAPDMGEEYKDTSAVLIDRLKPALKALKKEMAFTIELMEAMGVLEPNQNNQ